MLNFRVKFEILLVDSRRTVTMLPTVTVTVAPTSDSEPESQVMIQIANSLRK